MQLTCKFVPSSKVTNKELNYILTPDECVRQLSRMRKSQDVIAQLPKQLLDQLPLSARKDLYSLQTGIKSQLVKGQWVALALFPRQYPISNDQLSSYPALMRIIDGLQDQPSKKQTKAGYQQVADDVPLARNYTYNPVEPSPDKKIVVEFAGQWRNHAACLMLGKTEAQPEKVSNAKPDAENSHRSLTTFKSLEDEAKSLYIKIPCVDQPTPIKLKLADNIIPVDKDEKMDEWDNVLVPVVPLDHKGEEYAVKDVGCFYIVWNNKVWREIEIQENGHFSDIDIDYFRNATPPSAENLRHLDINGATLIEECYMGAEPFDIIQDGEVFKTEWLSLEQTARVQGLSSEEIEIKFHNIEHDPILLETLPSPKRAGLSLERRSQGNPLPHIWLPYKINGEIQDNLFVHCSKAPLTISQIEELEKDPQSSSLSLEALMAYSEEHNFEAAEGPLTALSNNVSQDVNPALIKDQQECNIAALKIASGSVPTVIYLHEPDVDQEDDFFEIRNLDEDWSSRTYLSSSHKDQAGYYTLHFAFPPPEVKTVDLLRAAHSDLSKGQQYYITIEEDIPVSSLLG
ncbi:hypothetical protein KP803_09695 [Vibrio sp. ZSDE26]|uniref:Uncharacterized protein n=1 Tax=Vibrio amylolyticus TaxID=2847292 RepID=A0A9X2BL44_9VIBR|nr:hypothetical protein [Vibrio amylolyticus]MCK6263543.1 hypothetical protein [Vibrio amylolyticus]